MKDLVLEAKNGNKEAFTQLILNIKNDLYKICVTRLNNEHDIDDAIQETMLQAYEKIHQLHDNSKFKAWTIKILINNCNLIYKRKKKTILLNDENNIFEYLEKSENLGNINLIENTLDFYKLISGLTYKEKIILILYYAEDFSINEISKILNMNENTVKTKIRRAKEKIKSKIEGGVKIG